MYIFGLYFFEVSIYLDCKYQWNDLLPPSYEECNSRFFSDILVVAWKDSYALNCLPHIVSFGMQFKFDHLIRQVIEIQSLELHYLWNSFSNSGLHFSWDGGSMIFFHPCTGLRRIRKLRQRPCLSCYTTHLVNIC